MTKVMDANQAAATVAYLSSEVVAIYPITPASPMGELADQWSAEGRPNLWGEVPKVVEMQSEGGAAGAVHGSLQAGSLTTTFTASQGLLLMLPNMFKLAGELTSTVFHVASRSVATHALSIFGDHSDVMAARSTGFAILFSAGVQEAMDMALVAQAASLASRIPFLHSFDGFRTSHELARVEPLTREQMLAVLGEEGIRAHRSRALNPEQPVLRGTAQNPDVFFQAREAANRFYQAAPEQVEAALGRLAEQVGRSYQLFEYSGHPEAERVVVLAGSATLTAREAVNHLVAQGHKVGVVKVRLFRPFSAARLSEALPPSVKRIAVLDRTKEPGAPGEPLYLDVVGALAQHKRAIEVVGGRYGLSSKEFTPSMVVAVLDELNRAEPRHGFTVGIQDDVTGMSLDYDPQLVLEDPESVRALFYGLGSDGTVSANKNSIKIIGEQTDRHVQGYFVYDSKKAGARTVSHLRFGPNPVDRPYLIQKASFVAVHQFEFVHRYPVLETAEKGAVLLLNSPHPAGEVWDHLPPDLQATMLDKQIRFYLIDAYAVARECGLGGRINTIMQAAFFQLSGVLPAEQAIAEIKSAIRQSYGKRGEIVVRRNFAAVDAALEGLHQVELSGLRAAPPAPPTPAGDSFIDRVTRELIAERGDRLPVSALPCDGTFPTGTAELEKRSLTTQIPVLESDLCIQCGKCVYVCPHSVIRAKLVAPESLTDSPPDFLTLSAAWKELRDHRYTLQVSADDCTGCALCVEVCPARDKSRVSRKALNLGERPAQAREHWEYFLSLPDRPPPGLNYGNVKNLQLRQPLFEFSGACAGCGETPYLRILTQLFGDRALIANATGCSSIYGGNLPTTPWRRNLEGHGPAWSNSLFEDNAEFGMGMRIAVDHQRRYADRLLHEVGIGRALRERLSEPEVLHSDAEFADRRRAVAELKSELAQATSSAARDLLALADVFVPRSLWLVGGDGWAYDIGFGGLDHVLAGQTNVNVLVLDTEVYSNTGGQSSKATPLGAVAKFAAAGKPTNKKDLGRLAMTYGHVYVASLAMGANQAQTIKAFQEAESYPGPSLLIAYSQCIAHGIDMVKGNDQQRLAVESGHWLLYRYDPRRREQGLNPLQLDSRAPSVPLKDYLYNEGRYRVLSQLHPDDAQHYLEEAQSAVRRRWQDYQELAGRSL